jgi:hypothetical protein
MSIKGKKGGPSREPEGSNNDPYEIAKIDDPSDHFLSQPASRGIDVSLGGKRVHRSPLSVWSVPLFTIEETQERDQLARQGQGWTLVRSLSSVLGPAHCLCLLEGWVGWFLLWTKLQRSLHLTWRKEICFFNWWRFLFLLHQPHHTTLTSLCPNDLRWLLSLQE